MKITTRSLSVLLCFIAQISIAQNSICDPPPVLPYAFVESPLNIEKSEQLVKVYFHVYRDGNGEGGQTAETLSDMVDHLNDSFASSEFSFFYNPCESRWIQDSLLHNSIDRCDFFLGGFTHTDGIDIHVKGDEASTFNSASSIPGDELIVGGIDIKSGLPSVLSSTLPHEMGHCFGLFHTFHGTCIYPGTLCDGSMITYPEPEMGDYVSDTPLDPDGSVLKDNLGNFTCAFTKAGSCTESSPETTDYNPLTDNFMSYYYNPCRTSFTAGQIVRMHDLVLPEVVHNQIETFCCNQGQNIELEPGIHSLLNATYSGNLIVKSGAEVTITGTLSFPEDKEIRVERGARLIVDGGRLQSCSETQWKGVVVEGAPLLSGQLTDPYGPLDDNFAGTVILINGATIDNARDGISTNNRHKGFPQKKDYHGGLIYCDNATFSNCTRAVEIMKYGTQDRLDKSLFNNVSFTDLNRGVSVWASDGVTFTQCHFNNIEKSAIHSWDAAIRVYDGNIFENVNTGIDLNATKANELSPEIGRADFATNEFLSGTYGVYAFTVNNMEQLLITNNSFENSIGVFMHGPSFSDCTFNDFTGVARGYFSLNTHLNPNQILNNSFDNNAIGISALFRNEQLTFGNNCMEGILADDVWIYGDGALNGIVNISQGNEDVAAGNCFSKSGIPEINTQGTTVGFDYYVGQDQALDGCFYPEAAGNFEVNFATGIDSTDCGSELPGAPVGGGAVCFSAIELAPLKLEISAIDAEIAQLKNTSGAERLLNQAERCKVLALNKLAGLYAQTKAYTAANTYFATRPEFNFRLIPYANHLQVEDYIAARTYLNGIATTHAEEADYKISQGIYLDFLEAEAYSLPALDALQLTRIGSQPGPLNVYARTIYYLVTGERMPLSLPAHERIPRLDDVTENSQPFRIFPNPNREGIINVLGVSNYPDAELEIRNMQGQLIYYGVAKDQIILDHELKGLFLISIRQKEAIIHREKMLFLK